MSQPTPRVFIIRHGETEWSLNGRHTGTSDIPLTANGEKRMRATGSALVGADRLIVPSQLAGILVSPRRRAQRTLQLLLGAGMAKSGADEGESVQSLLQQVGGRAVVETREDVQEWSYGDYEGVTSKEIARRREAEGKPKWDIWRDGCPGGESPEDVTTRLDKVIAEIRQRFHKPAFDHIHSGAEERCPPCDVLVVAHGHILRAFASRWVGKDIHENPSLLLEAGGVGTLSYEHHSIDEPAILLGGSFVVDIVEEEEQKLKQHN